MFGIKKNKIAAAFISSAIIFSNQHVINTNSLGLGAKIINIKNKMPTWGKVLLGASLVLVPVGIGTGCWYYFTNTNTQDKNPENPEIPSKIDDKKSKDIDIDIDEKKIIYNQNLEKTKKIFGDKFNLFNNLLENSWEDLKKSLKSFYRNGITIMGSNPNSKNISFYNNEPKILWQLKNLFKNNQVDIKSLKKNSFKIQDLKDNNKFVNIFIDEKIINVSTKFSYNDEELRFDFNSK